MRESMHLPPVRRVAAVVAASSALLAGGPACADAANLRAGAGRADITPQTGYYLGGWTRADRTAHGQHTRLFARALVLERGDSKVALVSIDLFMVPGGMVRHVGQMLRHRRLSERNILISASHTHSGPGGYANFPTLNTAAPSIETVTDPFSFALLLDPEPADPQLYRFLTEQIAKAIRRADDDLGPAEAGWGSARITGLTRNRSLEAHLADHGVIRAYGQGDESEDPDGGYEHTIDPDVNVLRVDKVREGGGRVPIGAWSTFADHGTVTKSSFEFYNADHHASAMRVFERRVRRAGRVPAGQEVLNVYGNSDEGDMSAGLDRHGPAASDYVGRVEAAAMLRAWEDAGDDLSESPKLDLRWTRICFCGQMTGAGAVDDHSEVGLPFLTGSEEERGPLFDVTHQHFEDTRRPVPMGPQGYKLSARAGEVPNVVPLLAIRVGERLIVSVPGEATKEVGSRIKDAVGAAVERSSIERVVVSGLANEFALYFTTPEEYARQHYEGGNTHFGTFSSVLIQEQLAELAGRLARGEPAQPPVDFDPTNGVTLDGPPYPRGAANGEVLDQPDPEYRRLQRPVFDWQGGELGLDRPVDRAFVVAQRHTGHRWVRADDDLGLAMLWEVDDDGRYTARWEVPLTARPGRYRLVIKAKRYRLFSKAFEVAESRALEVTEVDAPDDHVAVKLAYPQPIRDVDLTHRPRFAAGGVVRFRIGDRIVRVSRGHGHVFSVKAKGAAEVRVDAGDARDRFGNTNGEGATLR